MSFAVLGGIAACSVLVVVASPVSVIPVVQTRWFLSMSDVKVSLLSSSSPQGGWVRLGWRILLCMLSAIDRERSRSW